MTDNLEVLSKKIRRVTIAFYCAILATQGPGIIFKLLIGEWIYALLWLICTLLLIVAFEWPRSRKVKD